MKTKAPPAQPMAASPGETELQALSPMPPAQATQGEEPSSAFYALLERQVQPHSATATAATTSDLRTDAPASLKAEGIAIGSLVDVSDDGRHIQVQIPSLGLGPLPAVSMVALGPQHIGQSVALGFEGAHAHRPVVLGLMMSTHRTAQRTEAAPHAEPSGQSAVQISQNGHRVVIQAHTELELRCGEAVILLSEDGHIQIRGAYITNQASASNRIRGGSVQIN